MKNLLLIITIVLTVTCSSIEHNTEQRELQSKITSQIKSKATSYAACIKGSKLYSIFDIQRLRVVIYLTLNSRGQIDSFRLDDKKYPDSFAECMFNTVDLISFPKLEDHQEVQLEQPFIFVKNN